MHDAHHEMKIYNLDGNYVQDIILPTLGSIVEISGKPQHTEMFIRFTSFLYPPTIFRYDFLSGTLSLLYSASIDFEAATCESTQPFHTSKAGTPAPMFLTRKHT